MATVRAPYRSGSAAEFVDRLQSRGRYGFAVRELVQASGLSTAAAGAQLKRLHPRVKSLYPKSGFYVVVPPEHQANGAPPASWWIDDFFTYHNEPYYIALLSAAAHWGVSHQAAQLTQVMTVTPRRAFTLGRVKISFLSKKALGKTPVVTATGGQTPFKVSTPEATVLDLLRYLKQSGGLPRVLQILNDLASQLRTVEFRKALKAHPEVTLVQRTGFILEALGHQTLSRCAAEALSGQRLHPIPLSSGTPTDAPFHAAWGVYGVLPMEADA
ncbi:type IV toxin-antitoxin system AbiEi family antitoxin [Pelagibius sp. 7325]|uniref:type IV toxin-antitoxin system AbiEi family antitoxin domain-containing protein n=1 Tax=Pelagibius sp. 7325 TaxID=3131994 RepID=UPI0030EF3E7C